ncbi:MAG: trans-acting enoyl reductase family protein [Haloglomus sp.]
MDLLIYGSYGYTGDLIARQAAEAGATPTLAGRDRTEVQRQAAELDLPFRVFDLDADDVAAHLEAADADAVLNCAGPFVETHRPMVDACVETGTHYLDITGEIEVFESIAARDEAAAEADVQLLPGVGFDVVPTDCLAAHLAERLPDATALRLGFQAEGGISPGTAATAVNSMGEGGAIRRDGRIKSVDAAYDTRHIDFGRGETGAISIPWGDVSTAYYTTGIGDITVYIAVPGVARLMMRSSDLFAPLFALPGVTDTLQELVRATVEGPDEATREHTNCYVWGEASNDEQRVVSRLVTPNTYALTVDAALLVARKVLDGEWEPGFGTPGGIYGPELVLEIDGVERTDEEPVRVVNR